MTGVTPAWYDGPLTTIPPGDDPVAWSVAIHTNSGVVPVAEDLRDATIVRDGAARLARRLLARALVARVTGCGPDDVRLARDAWGAPRVTAPAGWHVSLSGRSDHALIGVARVPIGVDREPLAPTEIPWDMLAPSEVATLRALPEADRVSAWLTRWTIKEAHAKLIGEPRRIAPEKIVTMIGADGRGCATFEGMSRVWTRTTLRAAESVAMWDPSVAEN